MSIDLDALELLASHSPFGPWSTQDNGGGWVVYDADTDWLADTRYEEEACYIAAVSPNVVLELIAEVRRLRERQKCSSAAPT